MSNLIPQEILVILCEAFEKDELEHTDVGDRMKRLIEIAEKVGDCVELCKGDDTLLEFIIQAGLQVYIDYRCVNGDQLDEVKARADVSDMVERALISAAELNKIVRKDPVQVESAEALYYRAFRGGLQAYAFDVKGTMKVGNPPITLKDALDKTEETWNYNPELPKAK